jgi:hypothetical protein
MAVRQSSDRNPSLGFTETLNNTREIHHDERSPHLHPMHSAAPPSSSDDSSSSNDASHAEMKAASRGDDATNGQADRHLTESLSDDESRQVPFDTTDRTALRQFPY